MVGPTLPAKVAKAINQPLLIASAALSDLSSQGKVKISNLKVGGSPLYYLPGQEEELMKFASKTDKKFYSKLIVYRDLRERGFVVKTGYKFGFDLRVYPRGKKPGEEQR